MTDMTIDKRYENSESQRYYRVMLARDLFGEWVITRVWGGIGKATGRITHMPCTSYEAGLLGLQKIEKARVRRGYLPCPR